MLFQKVFMKLLTVARAGDIKLCCDAATQHQKQVLEKEKTRLSSQNQSLSPRN